MKSRFLSAVLLSGLVAGSFAAPELDIPKEIPDEPFEITAARIEYTNDTLIASGSVTGRFERVMLRADEVTGSTTTGDIHAEGNILFERDNVVWRGSELDYNFLTQTGNFGPSSLEFDPVLMNVDHVERVSTNEYLLRGATFTTCTRTDTHYHVRVKEAHLVDEKYLTARGATFYLGSVPILYLPVWRQTLSRSIFTFQAGYGSEWGAFGMVRATVPVTEKVNWITDVNGYSRRGVGVGQGFEWDYPDAKGEISGFYLDDQDPYARYDSPLIGQDRYRAKLEHLQFFTERHYLNTKWNYLSDPAVLEEYFKREYRSYAQPENYASWVYGNRRIGSEVFVNKRLNEFYDNVDRVEYSADLYRMRLGNSPFYFQSENSAAYLDRVYSETNVVDTAYDSVRLDTMNTVYMPQRYSFLSVVPRAGYRATYYSESQTGQGEELRQIPGAGVEVSFEASRVLSERARWYGRGLRHRIQPYADYIYADSSLSSSELLKFDDVDLLDDENKVKVGLRNILQTRRDGRVSRFIDLDLYTYYMIEEETGVTDNFDSLYLDARMPLTKRSMVDIYGVVDWNNGTIPLFNTRYSYDMKDVILSMEHLYRDPENQSLWTPRIDLYPDGKWSFEGYGRYEDKSGDLEEIAMVGYVNYCCMRYGLGYHFYDDNEHAVMLSIGLSAFPEARISSSF